MDQAYFDEQIDRLVGQIRAHGLVLHGIAALALAGDADPPASARAMRAVTGDKFADALPAGKLDPEREARVNHYSAHFVETFWTNVERALAQQ